MTATFRALTPADFADACALYAALSTGHSLPPQDVGRTGFARLLAHPGTWVIGVEQNSQIVAMATLHLLPNMTYRMGSYALVENVATLPSCRGRGFGRLVMEAVAQKAWTEGAYKIMLLTNRQRGATGFYEKLGYSADEKNGMILRRG